LRSLRLEHAGRGGGAEGHRGGSEAETPASHGSCHSPIILLNHPAPRPWAGPCGAAPQRRAGSPEPALDKPAGPGEPPHSTAFSRRSSAIHSPGAADAPAGGQRPRAGRRRASHAQDLRRRGDREHDVGDSLDRQLFLSRTRLLQLDFRESSHATSHNSKGEFKVPKALDALISASLRRLPLSIAAVLFLFAIAAGLPLAAQDDVTTRNATSAFNGAYITGPASNPLSFLNGAAWRTTGKSAPYDFHDFAPATYLDAKLPNWIDVQAEERFRYEAYDWPQEPGAPPELLEEYTYLDLKLNNGFTDEDFSTQNPTYHFLPSGSY